MSRRRYVVSYDVSDDKRRTQIFKTLKDYGDHVQWSVFICELNRREHLQLVKHLDQHVHAREDQVLFIDLGSAELDTGRIVTSLGRAYDPPVRVLVV